MARRQGVVEAAECERMEEGYASQEQQDGRDAAPLELAEIDGGDEDEMLSRSEVMSRAEIARRRQRRVRQLSKLYRMQYWALLEELRSRYRRFYLRTGNSGWREDDNMDEDEPFPMNAEPVTCGVQECSSRPMPLSSYCFAHILSDPRQCLYKPCAYVLKSPQTGTCGKPVLKAVIPSFCPEHFQIAQRQAARIMKRTSYSSQGSLGTFAGKDAPKLHVLISEYVRAIQNKRLAPQ